MKICKGRYLIVYLVLFSSFFTVLTPDVMAVGNDEHRIFHISRSKNKNIVCYDARFTKDGKLNTEDPVHAYWINQTDKPGERSDLSYIQNKMAYGYHFSRNQAGEVEISLVAFPDRKLRLVISGAGLVEGRMLINGKESRLSRIHVQADPSNSLRVLYIDLFGNSLEGFKQVSERIYNK